MVAKIMTQVSPPIRLNGLQYDCEVPSWFGVVTHIKSVNGVLYAVNARNENFAFQSEVYHESFEAHQVTKQLAKAKSSAPRMASEDIPMDKVED